ncbi:sugar transferase [Thalassobacillus pellis]|uniref:sugar transferase n=1 Tax=Thalassobacillus pellis TaxID=748008 RepID=UPI001961E30D|nr:sugar transferase [Thalassobacillus pellis]MBM7551664.1 lipopolysaccharide/colanic/teichoic acid biosynthesis glycosyltransferase [Thalassobacillus pellis]
MYKRFIKRLIDILVAFFLIPLFSFLFIIVGIAIKIEDGGKIIYKGKRVGKNKKQYTMYKFRSMKQDAKDIRNSDGSTFNATHDDRVTEVGKIIRKLSVDEIPQILNVLKGDMSFIGPRPSPIGNEQLYPKDYARKFTIRPGITGFNQAYFRNDASITEKQKNDLYYVDNISFKLDFELLLVTVYKVFKREGIINKSNN